MCRSFPVLSRVVLTLMASALMALPGLGAAASAGAEEAASSQVVPFVVTQDPDGVQRATVLLDDLYIPSQLVVRAGIPVELKLVSQTLMTPHNFILNEGGVQVAQEVGAGDTETVRFILEKPGRYTFYCDKRLLFFKSHRDKGMEGWVEVRP